jgi:hypothetical protein
MNIDRYSHSKPLRKVCLWVPIRAAYRLQFSYSWPFRFRKQRIVLGMKDRETGMLAGRDHACKAPKSTNQKKCVDTDIERSREGIQQAMTAGRLLDPYNDPAEAGTRMTTQRQT